MTIQANFHQHDDEEVTVTAEVKSADPLPRPYAVITVTAKAGAITFFIDDPDVLDKISDAAIRASWDLRTEIQGTTPSATQPVRA